MLPHHWGIAGPASRVSRVDMKAYWDKLVYSTRVIPKMFELRGERETSNLEIYFWTKGRARNLKFRNKQFKVSRVTSVTEASNFAL